MQEDKNKHICSVIHMSDADYRQCQMQIDEQEKLAEELMEKTKKKDKHDH